MYSRRVIRRLGEVWRGGRGVLALVPPAHRGATSAWARGGGAFGLLICEAAYTPAALRRTGSDKAPSGQASDVLAWHEAVRPVHSLRPERVPSCHHGEIVGSGPAVLQALLVPPHARAE
jgi:hypothetical protein